jgi:hypothetical protein
MGMYLMGVCLMGVMCVETFRFSIWVFGKSPLYPTVSGPPQKTELQTTGTKLQTQISGLQHHVKDLTLTSEGHQKIRDRFLEVYR